MAIAYVYIKRKNNTNEVTTSNNKYDEQIKFKIKEIEKKFMKGAIGFYIQEKAFELNLNSIDKEKIFQKTGYKEEFASPTINWTTEFEFMKNDIEERDKLLMNYLKDKDSTFCKDNEFVLNCFERYLLKLAKDKAKQLVSVNT